MRPNKRPKLLARGRSSCEMASAAVALVVLAACKGPPARLIASIADTVVVNNARPVQMPMHVFDAAGHVLPDTGVRFQWTSGRPHPRIQPWCRDVHASRRCHAPGLAPPSGHAGSLALPT